MIKDDTHSNTGNGRFCKTKEDLQVQLLRESEEKYRRLFETMALGVVYQDINGKIISANPAAEEILGLTFDQMVGRTSTDPRWKSIHEDGSEFLGEDHPAMVALKTGKKIKNVVMGVFDPEKERTRWINITATPQYRKNVTKPYQVYTTFEDITKRLNAENLLKKSEQRYNQLFGSMNEGVAIHEVIYKDNEAVDYRIIDINSTYENILGLKKGEVVNKKGTEIYNTNNAPYLKIYSKVADTGDPTRFDTYFEPMDKYFGISVFSPSKGVFVTVFEDITLRKRAEKKLKSSNLYNRSLIEASLDPLVTIGPDGKVTDVNNATEAVTGYSRGDIIGSDFSDYFTDPTKAKEGYKEVFREGFVKDYPLKILNKNGHIIPVLYNASVYYDVSGEVVGIFAAARDITEIKKAEQNLRESEANFRSIFNNMLNGFAYCKMIYKEGIPIDFIYLDVNKSFGELTGLYDVEGKKVSEIIPKIQKTDQKLIDTYGRVALTGNPETLETYVDALKMWFSISVYSPKKEYFVAIFDVITKRKQSEEKIKTSLKEKEVLLKEIHHRVKNNMQIISSLLNLQTKYVDEKETVDILKESQNRVKSMAMIHERIYLSKDLNHINFVDYIHSLVSNLFYTYNIKNGLIKPVLEIGNVNLNMETAVPCGLIISELVSNSLKYAFPNDMKGNIFVSLKSLGEKYELIVRDDGIGLPEKINFNKLDSLGLLLVNNLAEQIDGEIEINTSVGTEFKIYFKELEYKNRL